LTARLERYDRHMQGMQGVTLVVSVTVFFVTLAAPAGLLASEPVDPAPAGTPAAAPEPTTPPLGGTEAEVGEPAPTGGEPAPTGGEPAPTGGAPQAPAPAPASDVAQPPATQPEATIAPAKGGKQRGASAAATRTVAMRNIKFNPRDITVDRGDTVTWENEDAERHNAIGENNSFDTPVIDQGETSQHTFNNAGTIDYFCTLHANMEGTITVRGSGGGGGGSGGGGDGSTDGGSGAGGTAAPGTGSGTTGIGSSGTTGTTSSSSSSSSLPVTGSDLLWLALIGYGLLAIGAFVRLGAIGR
jgi:plastocyanin